MTRIMGRGVPGIRDHILRLLRRLLGSEDGRGADREAEPGRLVGLASSHLAIDPMSGLSDRFRFQQEPYRVLNRGGKPSLDREEACSGSNRGFETTWKMTACG